MRARWKRRRGLVVAALAVLLLGGGAAIALWRDGHDRGEYKHLLPRERLAAINDAFAAMDDVVVLFGDSHNALLGDPGPLCGRPVVNAGVGGISVNGYRNLFTELRMPRPARAALLTIGSNTARKKWLPRSRSAFRDNATALIAAIQAHTKRLVVTAVPPVSADVAHRYDLAALKAYSDELEAICRRAGCLFVDPFAGSRSENPVLARPGVVLSDGVHLADYSAPLATSAALLCR